MKKKIQDYSAEDETEVNKKSEQLKNMIEMLPFELKTQF